MNGWDFAVGGISIMLLPLQYKLFHFLLLTHFFSSPAFFRSRLAFCWSAFFRRYAVSRSTSSGVRSAPVLCGSISSVKDF